MTIIENSNISTTEKTVIEIPLSPKNIHILTGLVKWSKIVGVFNIILGILFCLSIFLFMLPTVVIGIFFVFLGTRLTNASSYLRYCIYEHDGKSMMAALENIKKYLLLNGIMFIIMFIFVIVILSILFLFGVAIFEIFEEISYPYVSALVTYF